MFKHGSLHVFNHGQNHRYLPWNEFIEVSHADVFNMPMTL